MKRSPSKSAAGRREPPPTASPAAQTLPSVPWWRKWLLVAAVLLELAWMGILLSMAGRK
jgi:hypothetical protein